MPSIIQTRAQRAAAAAAAAASVPGAFPTAPLLSASLGDYRPATNEPPVFAERINITGHHPLLPHIYKCKQHPQRSESYKGDIYVLYGDYTKAGHAELLKNIGDKEPFALPGFLKLDPHKQPMVYCRNKYGQAGEPDQIKSWALGRQSFSKDELTQRHAARDWILGNSEDLTASAPIKHKDGTFEGGTQFERSIRAKPVKKGTRAYTLSMSYQRPPKLSGPTAGMRATENDPDDGHFKGRKQLLSISAQCAQKVMRIGMSAEEIKTIVDQIETINMPHIGVDENFCSSAFQLNLAGTERELCADSPDSLQEKANTIFKTAGPIAQLGRFGRVHLDKADFAALFTVMHMLSRDDPHIEEQLFYILELGIAWIVCEDTSVAFSGLYMHTGCLPQSIPGDEDQDDTPYTRITAVSYCPTPFYDGKSSWAFCGGSTNRELERLLIEMQALTSPSHFFAPRVTSNKCNLIADGINMMEDQSYLDFVSRGFCQKVAFSILQAPAELSVRFDRDKFLSCFSMLSDGQRIEAQPWPLGPGWLSGDCQPGPSSIVSITDSPPLSATERAEAARRQQASDDPARQDCAFGNPLLDGSIAKDFDALANHHAQGIPICALAQRQNGPPGGTPALRKSIFKDAQAGALDSADSTVVPCKRKQARKDVATSDEESDHDDSEKRPMRKCRKTVTTTDEVEPTRKGKGKQKRKSSAPVVFSSTPEPTVNTVVDPPLIEALTLSELEMTRQELRTCTMEVIGEDWESWSLFCDAVVANEDAVSRVARAADHLRWLKAQSDASDMTARIHQQCFLLHRMAMWKWLEAEVDEVLLMKKKNWLTGLCQDIQMAFESPRLPRTQPVKIWDTSIYIPSLNIPASRTNVTMSFPQNPRYDPPSDMIKDRVLKIVASWLDFKSTFNVGRPQAELVFRLVAAYGPGILLVRRVLLGCTHLKRDLFQGLGDSVPTLARVRQWCNKYLRLGMEEERGIVDDIDTIVDIWRSDTQRYLPQMLKDTIGCPWSPSMLIPPPSTWSSSSVGLDRLRTLLEPLYPMAAVDNPIPSFSDPDSSYALAMFDSKYQAFVQHIVDHSDKQNPWRDLAQSRAIILDDGPFSPPHLRTAYGLFSAVIYRAVTHNSQFLLEQRQTVFQDLDEWLAVIDDIEDEDGNLMEDGYFCNPNAYGSWTRRSLDIVASYAHSVQDPLVTDWLVHSQRPSFSWLYNHLLNIHTLVNKRSVKAFNGLGPLGALVLAGRGLKLGWSNCFQLLNQTEPQLQRTGLLA